MSSINPVPLIQDYKHNEDGRSIKSIESTVVLKQRIKLHQWPDTRSKSPASSKLTQIIFPLLTFNLPVGILFQTSFRQKYFSWRNKHAPWLPHRLILLEKKPRKQRWFPRNARKVLHVSMQLLATNHIGYSTFNRSGLRQRVGMRTLTAFQGPYTSTLSWTLPGRKTITMFLSVSWW